jgi:hypothetical protein
MRQFDDIIYSDPSSSVEYSLLIKVSDVVTKYRVIPGHITEERFPLFHAGSLYSSTLELSVGPTRCVALEVLYVCIFKMLRIVHK